MRSFALFSAVLLSSSILFSSCAKKDAPPNPHANMKMTMSGSPQAGTDMSQSANPHAGMDMGKPNDPHGGMNIGMNGNQPGAAHEPVIKDGMMNVEGLLGFVPKTWKSVPPSSSMRLAQLQLPAAKGDKEPGEVAVFYLGPDGGGVEANIARWCDQFVQPDGKPTTSVAKREELTIGNLKATLVSFTGTMGASTMPGMPQTGPKEGWMNLSAIVVTPSGPIFFKGTGPEKTMKEQVETMKGFLKGMRFGQG